MAVDLLSSEPIFRGFAFATVEDIFLNSQKVEVTKG